MPWSMRASSKKFIPPADHDRSFNRRTKSGGRREEPLDDLNDRAITYASRHDSPPPQAHHTTFRAAKALYTRASKSRGYGKTGTSFRHHADEDQVNFGETDLSIEDNKHDYFS